MPRVQRQQAGLHLQRACAETVGRWACVGPCTDFPSGPRPGWRQRLLERSVSPPVGNTNTLGLQQDGQQQQQQQSWASNTEEDQEPPRSKRRQSTPSPDGQPRSRAQQRLPLLGLPPPLVDQLLAVYFTHVHVRYRALGIPLTTECLAAYLQAFVPPADGFCTPAIGHAIYSSMRGAPRSEIRS